MHQHPFLSCVSVSLGSVKWGHREQRESNAAISFPLSVWCAATWAQTEITEQTVRINTRFVLKQLPTVEKNTDFLKTEQIQQPSENKEWVLENSLLHN